MYCSVTSKWASRHNSVHFFNIWTSKNGPSMVCFVHFDLEMCFAPQRRALFQHLNFQKWSGTEVFCTFWLRNVLRATTACTFSTSQLPKVVRAWCVFYILTWKCASRHNGVHFFNISTSKSGPELRCFVHFDFEMCFAPQRRALFRHLNFQKWSQNGVFCTFWLRNVLRATTACTFSTSQLPKVVPEWCVLYILTSKCASRHNGVHFSTSQLPKVVRTWGVLYLLTWKCASRHNGVQFFISPLASWLRTRRFSEPTFRPSRATNHWKNTVFRDFPTFSRICIFCPLTLSLLLFSLLIFLFSLPLPYSAFHLSILSEVWLLNFLRLYIIIYAYRLIIKRLLLFVFIIYQFMYLFIYLYMYLFYLFIFKYIYLFIFIFYLCIIIIILIISLLFIIIMYSIYIICICVYIYICMYVYIYMYLCMYVLTYVCVCFSCFMPLSTDISTCAQ